MYMYIININILYISKNIFKIKYEILIKIFKELIILYIL